MRLFAAVQPPLDALDHLERALGSVRGAADPGDTRGPVRWTSADDRHLTLAFYGEVPDGRLEELSAELTATVAGAEPFPVTLRGAGVFDHRTLWIGCADPDGRLAALSARAVALGEELLGRRDDRVRSRAHLTVGRVRDRARTRERRGRGRAAAPGGVDVVSLVHALAVYDGPRWDVAEVVLVSSRLGAGDGGHPAHDVVHRAALGAVAG